MGRLFFSFFIFLAGPMALFTSVQTSGNNELPTNSKTQLLWGDTHLHTYYSFDAFLNQNYSATPDTAYRWAKGEPVIHPKNRTRVQINTPLDFLVVSDHAEELGVFTTLIKEGDELLSPMGPWDSSVRWMQMKIAQYLVSKDRGEEVFNNILPKQEVKAGGDPVQDESGVMYPSPYGDTTKIRNKVWTDIVETAERHNEPGKFTSLIGWEWSSTPAGANLHRVVFTPDGADKALQFLPYGSDVSQYPEDLWAWLDATQQKTGSRFVAIPHNPNISKGYMFGDTTLKGKPITPEYSKVRMNWEPVVEMTQVKGDSETHPLLSPEDNFADFESYGFYIQQRNQAYKPKPGDYVRSSLITGMAIEQQIGTNPYKFGMIGSTDSHTGLATAEEDNFWGKYATDSTPETKNQDIIGAAKNSGWDMAAAGLTAVWAQENTREAIYAAFKRKEVYATTGTRIGLQFFGGWNLPKQSQYAEDLAKIGYRMGVPMGGDLITPNKKRSPEFIVRAVKDPLGANLDRVQIVKGWVDQQGASHEKIYNVAWSGDRSTNKEGQLPAVGNTVDRNLGTYKNTIGSAELTAHWVDPQFDADQRAFYYVRVLEIPTPRHSLFDKIALDQLDLQNGPETLQERAYSSPIWYTPQ